MPYIRSKSKTSPSENEGSSSRQRRACTLKKKVTYGYSSSESEREESTPRKQKPKSCNYASDPNHATPKISRIAVAKTHKISKAGNNKSKISKTAVAKYRSQVLSPISSSSYARDSHCETESDDNSSGINSFTDIHYRKGDKKKKKRSISPATYKFYMNLYKDSPTYLDLKNKRFNTSFLSLRNRHCGERDIVFTPEELNNPPPVPDIPNRMGITVPGEKYADVFRHLPFSDSDEAAGAKDIEKTGKKIEHSDVKKLQTESVGTKKAISKKTKAKKVHKNVTNSKRIKNDKKKKRGRPKSIGYKGCPLPDENLVIDYNDLFNSDSLSVNSDGKDGSTDLAAKQEKENCKILYNEAKIKKGINKLTDNRKTENDKKKKKKGCSRLSSSR